jgi:predicted MPP superfamily phosphohydrolase
VRTTNELKPDIVVLSEHVTLSAFGDHTSVAHHAKPCAQLLSELHAPLGVFGVLGNHDQEARTIARTLEMTGSPYCVISIFTLSVQERASGSRD